MITEITSKTHGCGRTKDVRVVCAEGWVDKPVDKCLVDIVQRLNSVDLWTASCCCGHGVVEGTIILHNKITVAIPRCKKYDS